MTNKNPVLKNQPKKQMEKELYNLELDEQAEQIRNDLRNHNIKYAVLYNFIKDDLLKRNMITSVGTYKTMKNMLVRSGNRYRCNIINRIRLISAIRKNKDFNQAIVAVKDMREKQKKDRESRKLELIKLLNDKDTQFGREYSPMEKFRHHSLNMDPSQQVVYQEKEDGIFRDKRR